jgi:hypothetical protein
MSRTRKRTRKRCGPVCGDASHLYKTLELPNRAARSSQSFHLLKTTILRLLEDENFVTLLRAESMLTVPRCLLADEPEGK